VGICLSKLESSFKDEELGITHSIRLGSCRKSIGAAGCSGWIMPAGFPKSNPGPAEF